MAKKEQNDYFRMFVTGVDYSCRAADSLQNTLRNFDPATLPETMEKLHEIEHAADDAKHTLMEKLTKEFLPPIEREDIVALAREIDNVTDAIEDILLKIYMYDVHVIREDALTFTDLLVRCCTALKAAMEEMRYFKKSDKLRGMIIEINSLEEEGDKLYTAAVRTLFTTDVSPLEIFVWTEVFAKMEKCCDAVEHTANVIESVIMKNI